MFRLSSNQTVGEMNKIILVCFLAFLVAGASARRRGGGGGRGGGRHRGGKCADGTKPTCSDGSAPVFDGDR